MAASLAIAEVPLELYRIRDAQRVLTPALGEFVYLLPRHVCPTVNNFDEALIVRDGRIEQVERVTAPGHEAPLPAAVSA